MKNKIERVKQLFLQKEKMIVIALIGILLFVICIPVEEQKSVKPQEELTAMQGYDCIQRTDEQYKNQLEKELGRLLSHMEGVGDVEVMITLQSTGKKILAKDEPKAFSQTDEEDAQGGKRKIEERTTEEVTIYHKSATGEESPYVIEETIPKVEGVFIVAEGGEEDRIRLQITEAVQALFDVEAHKIKIVKRKS